MSRFTRQPTLATYLELRLPQIGKKGLSHIAFIPEDQAQIHYSSRGVDTDDGIIFYWVGRCLISGVIHKLRVAEVVWQEGLVIYYCGFYLLLGKAFYSL